MPLESAADLGRIESESASGSTGAVTSTSTGAGSMTGVESGAAVWGTTLLAAGTTGVSTAGLGPIVPGANAGPGSETMAVLFRPDGVGRGGATWSGGDSERSAAGASAPLIELGRGVTGWAGAGGRAEARITRKVQATTTEATTVSCIIRRPPARTRAGDAWATGSSAGVTSG